MKLRAVLLIAFRGLPSSGDGTEADRLGVGAVTFVDGTMGRKACIPPSSTP